MVGRELIADWIEIVKRIHWMLPSTQRRYPATPMPWRRCHCGALADLRSDTRGSVDWCSPCKFAMHDTCECSQEASDGA